MLNSPGVPMYKLGNVLDLAITNIPLAYAKIAGYIHTGSNYKIIIITIPKVQNTALRTPTV